MDPWLPHGRAGHHQLRAGTAEGVSRRPRRRRRRHPGRPGRRRPLGGRGPWSDHRPGRRLPRGVGRAQPAALPPAGRPGPQLVPRASAGRPTASPSWSRNGRSPAGAGCSASCNRATRALAAAEKVLQALPGTGPPGRAEPPGWRSAGRRRSGRSATSSSTAPTPRPRRCSGSNGWWNCGTRGPRRRPRRLLLRSRRHRLGRLRAATCTCRRWSPTPGSAPRPGRPRAGRAHRTEPDRPGPPGRARRRAPPGRLRPGEHPASRPTWSSPTPGWPPAISTTATGSASRCARCARPRAAGPRPEGPGRLPALLLPPLRGRPGRADCGRDAWELFSDLLLTKSFPTGIRRVREHRRLGHRTLLITGALDVVIDPLRPLFDDVVCARLGEQDGRFTGELDTSPPTGEARALIMADYADANGPRPERVRRLRRLGQRSAHARGRRPPGGRQPRGQAGRDRPQAGLARRALAQAAGGRGWALGRGPSCRSVSGAPPGARP